MLLESLVNPENEAPPGLLVLWVLLAKMEKLELRVPLALLVLLVNEENKAPLAPPDFRVSLAPLVPLEKLANLVNRVFPETWVLLAHLEPEAKEASPESVECKGPPAPQAPVGLMVLLATMELRVMLELLEPPAARAHLVFRVCPVREVQPAFQDPRVTEVMLAPKVLMVLLAKMVSAV